MHFLRVAVNADAAAGMEICSTTNKTSQSMKPPPPPPKGLRGRSEETFPSYLPNSCCLFWLKSIALWMDLKFLRKHCFSLGCSSQVIVKWVRFGLKIRWEIQTFFTSFFCMIIREGRNDNNSNNVKRELCDKRFCYMLIQNWLQLSKLHQSGSQGEQFTPAGSHEETYLEILGTGVWAEIRKDKGQRSAPPGNCVKPLLALQPKGRERKELCLRRHKLWPGQGTEAGRSGEGRTQPPSLSTPQCPASASHGVQPPWSQLGREACGTDSRGEPRRAQSRTDSAWGWWFAIGESICTITKYFTVSTFYFLWF